MFSQGVQPTSSPQLDASPLLKRLAIGQSISGASNDVSRRAIRKHRAPKRPILERDAEICFLPPKRPTADFCTVSPAQVNLLARRKRCLLVSIDRTERISLGAELHMHHCSSGQRKDVELQIISPSLAQIAMEFHDKPSKIEALREIPHWNLAAQGTFLKARVRGLPQSQGPNLRFFYQHKNQLADLGRFLKNFFNTRDFEQVTEILTDSESHVRPISGQLAMHKTSPPWPRKLDVGKNGFKAQSISCRPQDSCELCPPAKPGRRDGNNKLTSSTAFILADHAKMNRRTRLGYETDCAIMVARTLCLTRMTSVDKEPPCWGSGIAGHFDKSSQARQQSRCSNLAYASRAPILRFDQYFSTSTGLQQAMKQDDEILVCFFEMFSFHYT